MRRLFLLLIFCGCTSRPSEPKRGVVEHDTHHVPSSTACTAAEGDGKTYVRLSPPDLTSAAEGQIISVWAEMPGALAPEMLATIAGRVSLVTWPEGSAVASTASIYAANDIYAADPYSKVIVTPMMSLPSRWYALKVFPLPDPIVTRSAGTSTLPTGEIVARFHYGSEPHVVVMQEIPMADPTLPQFHYQISVGLSEVLPIDVAFASVQLTGLAASECQPVPKYGDITANVNFHCKSSVIEGLQISVSLPGPAGSASTAAMPNSNVIQVEPTQVVTLEDSTKRFKVELR